MRINGLLILVCLIIAVYHPFFIYGKIPIPGDAMVGGFYPWLDYKWGYEVGVPVKNSTISDVYSAFYVWKNLSIDYIKNLEWPLWNPYSFSGAPFLGSFQVSHFFPFNILLLLPLNLGWALYIFGQTLVAALGMYFLIGVYSKKNLAKLVGALIFAFSGFMSTWVEFGNGVWAAAFLPWIFFSLEKYWEKTQIRFLLLFTFSFISLYLAGLTQMIIFASGLFVFYIIFKFVTKEVAIKQIILPVIYWILTFGVSTIQILPAFDLASESIRSQEAYAKQFNFGLSPLYEIVRLMVPDFFGNPTTYNEWSKFTYFEHSSFLGTLTLPLLLPLFFKRFRSKEVIFWGIVFIGSLLLVFDYSITRAIYSLPFPLLTYSSAGRLFFITTFSASILAGLAFNKMYDDKRFQKYLFASMSIFLIVTSAIFLGVLINYKANPALGSLTVTLKNMVIPLSILFLIVLASFRKFGLTTFLPFIIFTALYFDLGRYFLKYNPFVPNSLVFPTTPVIDFLKNQPGLFRIVRTDEKLLPTNTWIHYKISSIEGYDPMALENYNRFFNIVNDNSYKSRVSRFSVAKKFRDPFLDALNVKYLLVLKGSLIDRDFSKRYKKVFEDKSTVIYENADFLSRAYFVPRVTSVSDMEQMIKKIDDKSFNPEEEAVAIGGQTRNLSIDGEISIDSYKQSRVIITTHASSERFLVLADTFEKNWKLNINSRKAVIYEVNGALRGVLVPSGINKLEFNYWPVSFTWGLYIALSSIVAITALTVYHGMKGARPRSSIN